jgi:hypothetical protein
MTWRDKARRQGSLKPRPRPARTCISFGDDGCISFANLLQKDDRQRMHINDSTHLTHVYAETLPFFNYHRKKVFRL